VLPNNLKNQTEQKKHFDQVESETFKGPEEIAFDYVKIIKSNDEHKYLTKL